MDLSKLPKLSQTDAPPAAQNPPEHVNYASPQSPPQPGVGVDVWFNSIIGLLLVFMGRTFASWLWAKCTGHAYHTGVDWTDGRGEVAYFDLEGNTAWTDAGLFVFGVVVLIEAAVKAWHGVAKRVPKPVAIFAIALAMGGTALNMCVCAIFLKNQQVPLISGLAVAYGGYIVFDLMQMLKSAAIRRPAAGGA